MKLMHEDNGNCRVYYRKDGRLYCWQEDKPKQFNFYVCSRDGEPSHEVDCGFGMPLPNGETSVGRNLRAFLEMKRALGQLSAS